MMHRIFFAFIWIIGRVLLWIYRVDVKGLENLPKHSVLLCPNHSTDLDPVLIGLCLPLDYHLHFMAKAELFDNRALAWLIRTLGAFPVQRDGKDIQSIKTAMQVLHKGENLLIFPEGTTIRGGVGYHDGLPAHAHAGIAMIGVRTGATLVPVFCDGQKKPFRKTRIIFGEPYVPEVTGRRGTSEELQAIDDEMLRQASALRGQHCGKFGELVHIGGVDIGNDGHLLPRKFGQKHVDEMIRAVVLRSHGAQHASRRLRNAGHGRARARTQRKTVGDDAAKLLYVPVGTILKTAAEGAGSAEHGILQFQKSVDERYTQIHHRLLSSA